MLVSSPVINMVESSIDIITPLPLKRKRPIANEPIAILNDPQTSVLTQIIKLFIKYMPRLPVAHAFT